MNFSTPSSSLSPALPPTNVAAEQQVIGCLLANNKSVAAIVGILSTEHFADPINGLIFDAIVSRVQAGHLADGVTLMNEFRGAGLLDEVGGTSYLAQLVAAVVSPRMAVEYAMVVRDAWLRRRLIDLGETLAGAAGNAPDAGQVAFKAVADIERLVAGNAGLSRRAAVTLNEAMDAAIAQADALARGESKGGLTTGMPSVDAVFGGMEPGDLVVLGGRPGAGKSSNFICSMRRVHIGS